MFSLPVFVAISCICAANGNSAIVSPGLKQLRQNISRFTEDDEDAGAAAPELSKPQRQSQVLLIYVESLLTEQRWVWLHPAGTSRQHTLFLSCLVEHSAAVLTLNALQTADRRISAPSYSSAQWEEQLLNNTV